MNPWILPLISPLIVAGVMWFGRWVAKHVARDTREAVEAVVVLKLAPVLLELETIRAEVTYNEGQSLKDAVRRIEQSLA